MIGRIFATVATTFMIAAWRTPRESTRKIVQVSAETATD